MAGYCAECGKYESYIIPNPGFFELCKKFCSGCKDNKKIEDKKKEDSPFYWHPDSEHDQCEFDQCGIKFGFLERRHHCRNCGIVVCSKHSKYSFELGAYGNAQRVCDKCYINLTETRFPVGGYFQDKQKYKLLHKNIKDISANCPTWGNYFNLLGGAGAGYCFGMVFMWGQAILCNDTARYYRRLDYLTRNYTLHPFFSANQKFTSLSALIRYIETEQKKYSAPIERQFADQAKGLASNSVAYPNLYMAEESRISEINAQISPRIPGYEYLTEIRAFLDGLLVYQISRKTSLFKNSTELPTETPSVTDWRSEYGEGPAPRSSYLHGKDLFTQNAVASSRYLQHEKVGNLVRIYHSSHVYNKEGWNVFLIRLVDQLKSLNMPAFVCLSSTGHATGLYYNKLSDQAEFYDATYMTQGRYSSLRSLEVFGEEIIASFKFELEHQRRLGLSYKLLPLSVAIYIAQNQHNTPYLERVTLEPFKITGNEEACKQSMMLYLACEDDHVEVVQALKEFSGINPNQANNNGATPLSIACKKGHKEVVQALKAFRRIKPNQANNGVTPFFIACQNGHVEVVRALLAFRGIKPNQASDNGATPFFIACQNGHANIVKALIECNESNLNNFLLTPTNDKVSPLFIAVKMRRTQVVTYLIECSLGKIELCQQLYRLFYESKRAWASIHEYREWDNEYPGLDESLIAKLLPYVNLERYGYRLFTQQ